MKNKNIQSIDVIDAELVPADSGFIEATHKASNSDKCYKTGLICAHGCVGLCKNS